MIYRFRTSIHAMPPDTMAAIPGELAGKPVTLLQLSSAQQAQSAADQFRERGGATAATPPHVPGS